MNSETRPRGMKELVRAGELSARAAYFALLGRGYASGGQVGQDQAYDSGSARWLRNRIKKAGGVVPSIDHSKKSGQAVPTTDS